ncbi:unnamed protein product [Calicophoron daubneyi]|uniref:TGF-beta family profile domain-containing protein n=1 Tax=Calicophoron daubneyi TaxID=300641 RepID=A0AAV2TCN6_CALDB
MEAPKVLKLLSLTPSIVTFSRTPSKIQPLTLVLIDTQYETAKLTFILRRLYPHFCAFSSFLSCLNTLDHWNTSVLGSGLWRITFWLRYARKYIDVSFVALCHLPVAGLSQTGISVVGGLSFTGSPCLLLLCIYTSNTTRVLTQVESFGSLRNPPKILNSSGKTAHNPETLESHTSPSASRPCTYAIDQTQKDLRSQSSSPHSTASSLHSDACFKYTNHSSGITYKYSPYCLSLIHLFIRIFLLFTYVSTHPIHSEEIYSSSGVHPKFNATDGVQVVVPSQQRFTSSWTTNQTRMSVELNSVKSTEKPTPESLDDPFRDQNADGVRQNAPSKAELRARTPNYMFKLHGRHKNEWWNFGQFEADHMMHPLHLSDDQSQTPEPDLANSRRLGMITAIRSHRHVGTHDTATPTVSDEFQLTRNRRSAGDTKLSHEFKEHRLLFRLANMPNNEELVAASLRLRYTPRKSSQSENKSMNIMCKDEGHRHQWPITLWLSYGNHHNETEHGHSPNVSTIGFFEPEEPGCEVLFDPFNETLLNLPAGWFNIPLNYRVLELIQKTSQQRNESRRQIAIRVQSARHIYSPNSNLSEHLKLRRPSGIEVKEELSEKWLHEAPQLFTFHRDPQLVNYLTRDRRSTPPSSSRQTEVDKMEQNKNWSSHQSSPPTQSDQRARDSPPAAGLRTKVQSGKSFARRYKKLQKILHSGLKDTEELKRRSRRRAFYSRRQSRASLNNHWRQKISQTNSDYYSRYNVGERSSANAQRPSASPSYSSNDRVSGLEADYEMRTNQEQYNPTPDSNQVHQANSPSSYLDKTCQRRDLIIDFDAVGWGGWVIAPQAYNARYCRGQCPFPLSTHYNTTNHAVLLQLVHLLDAARISGPCCVPHQLSSQSLLYHSQNGDVVLRVYQDMVVESCACR